MWCGVWQSMPPLPLYRHTHTHPLMWKYPSWVLRNSWNVFWQFPIYPVYVCVSKGYKQHVPPCLPGWMCPCCHNVCVCPSELCCCLWISTSTSVLLPLLPRHAAHVHMCRTTRGREGRKQSKEGNTISKVPKWNPPELRSHHQFPFKHAQHCPCVKFVSKVKTSTSFQPVHFLSCWKMDRNSLPPKDILISPSLSLWSRHSFFIFYPPNPSFLPPCWLIPSFIGL